MRLQDAITVVTTGTQVPRKDVVHESEINIENKEWMGARNKVEIFFGCKSCFWKRLVLIDSWLLRKRMKSSARRKSLERTHNVLSCLSRLLFS